MQARVCGHLVGFRACVISLSHGYRTDTKNISAVSKYFTTMPYRLDESTGYIDYDAMEATAALFRPKMLIAGASAYSRFIDYGRMRKLADKHNCTLLADAASASSAASSAGGMRHPSAHASSSAATPLSSSPPSTLRRKLASSRFLSRCSSSSRSRAAW